jgi:hypothetical protein
MTQNHDHDSDLDICKLAAAHMNQEIRSDMLDKMVQLAIEGGSKKVHTFRGSGYLLIKTSKPREKYRAVYEIDVLLDSKLGRERALGCMIGDHSLFKRAMSCGHAQLAYAAEGAPADIQITQLEANRAYFTVHSGFGIDSREA